MNKFTKGPWDFYSYEVPHVTSDYSPEGDICDLYHLTDKTREVVIKDNAVANGHLISAAPCMYELLETLSSLNDERELLHENNDRLSIWSKEVSDAYAQVKIVLSKACGGDCGE